MPENFQHSQSLQPLPLEREHSREQKAEAAAPVDKLSDKLFRETYLITRGTASGFADQAANALENKKETLTNLGIGVASALTLSYFSRGSGLKAAIGWGAATGMTALGIKDGITHLKPAFEAVVDTFRSPDNFDHNLNKFRKAGGSFVFDTTVYGLGGGVTGSLLGRSLFNSRTSLHLNNESLTGELSQRTLGKFQSEPSIALEGKLPVAGADRTINKTIASDLIGETLNVSSKSLDGVGRSMSNFAETPFDFHGQRYASVEGFYQSLKFADGEGRARVAEMSGPIAKSFGRKGTAENVTFNGETFPFGSEQHHDLIKSAIRAKLEQNPQIAADFVATHPRPIVHDTGRPARKSSFSEETFTKILSDLREEFVSKPRH